MQTPQTLYRSPRRLTPAEADFMLAWLETL
jgi:hypothetical protein